MHAVEEEYILIANIICKINYKEHNLEKLANYNNQ